MTAPAPEPTRLPGYCALCVSRCGCTAVIEDGRFVALEPDPSHPTGSALCAKGRAAPELVYHPERLLHPLKRTRPKGDVDPGWQRISWDEALDITAAKLRAIADQYGPESVVFSIASPSTSASDDSIDWIERLRRAFGSPNQIVSMELCGWGRYLATTYTFGVPAPGVYMPDLERAGCILFWGYNPNIARLVHAVATADARKRGARLIVVDPRRTGVANRADVWLRVRPGTDGALALGIAHVMIERGWFDRDFVRDWTNGPLIVRRDTSRLLRESDLHEGGSAGAYVVWCGRRGRPVAFDPATGFAASGVEPALSGSFAVRTLQGSVECRPVFDLVSAMCRRYPPAVIDAICGIPPADVEAAARLLREARPVAYYAWSGVEMQSSATQIARAIAQLYTLTGSFDAPGGNVRFDAVPRAVVAGTELLPETQRARALGVEKRPLGPARWEFVTSADFYTAALEGTPYAVRGLVGFGANLLLAHADGRRGRRALASLDFYVHADLFMNPTAEMADLVLPVASPFEREALRIGFDVSPAAQSLVQLRQRVVEPRGEARSDLEIVFALAQRLGLGAHFFDGDIDAAWRHQLGPSGIPLDALRAEPRGVRVPLRTRHRKYAEDEERAPRGFATPSRRIELYSEELLEHGYAPLPDYEPPMVSTLSPETVARFPLVLTCAKHALFCETQHRALPSLRRRALEPEVELHPDAAAARGIAAGDRVRIETPAGSVIARARFNDSLQPDVVCGQHGWWQACEEIGAPGYDPFSDDGANFNLLIDAGSVDPVSGSVPHRAFVCDVRPVAETTAPLLGIAPEPPI
jgi:anaerobic selenocysteine-containing dehydrogenase